MSWFVLALIGHLSNGVAFIIDKILLRTAFSRSATYAGLIGALSSLVILASPFVEVWPHGFYWIAAAVSGATFVLAMWAFFAAMARAEASRIVPIVGSLIPILTLAGSFVFLGERLADRTFLGFALLIIATFILSKGGSGRPSHDAIWMAVTSAFLFAISSITAKATYDDAGFFGGFVASRAAAAAMAFCILTLLDRRAGQEVLLIFHPRRHKSSKHKQPGKIAALLAIIGQTFGAIGFLFVQWAISKGSASVVNAMQTVQYALLVLAAFILLHRAPQLLGENLTKKVLIIKLSAMVVAAAGMYLIA